MTQSRNSVRPYAMSSPVGELHCAVLVVPTTLLVLGQGAVALELRPELVRAASIERLCVRLQVCLGASPEQQMYMMLFGDLQHRAGADDVVQREAVDDQVD